MRKSRGGWGKYQREHSATVGDEVRINGVPWIIYSSTSPSLKRIQDEKAKAEENQTERLADPRWSLQKEKYPNMNVVYAYKVQKVTHKVDYKPYTLYRLLRRKVS
jgi:hypothetical protein